MKEADARAALLAKPEAREDYPFGPDVAVFKVKDKMFATLGHINGTPSMNLKCDPDRAAALRDFFDDVIPGYHMNKLHWNTVHLDGDVPDEEIIKFIDHSYALVVQNLSMAKRNALILAHGRDAVLGGLE